MAEVLSIDYMGNQAIYSSIDENNPIAYNLSIFEFLAHISLKNEKDAGLMKFTLDSLEFV